MSWLSRNRCPRTDGRIQDERRGYWRRDDGASAIEAVILAPALVLMISLAIVAMRIEVAGEAVDASAHDAARAASISSDATDARTAGRDAALATLKANGLTCSTLTVHVDVDGFSVQIGQPASVQATVTCIVSFSGLSIPGMPGTKRMRSTFISPIDEYGGRS
jgi:Flp pilus assembly protein TadG